MLSIDFLDNRGCVTRRQIYQYLPYFINQLGRKDGMFGDGWQSLVTTTFTLHLDENSDGSMFNTIVEVQWCRREGGKEKDGNGNNNYNDNKILRKVPT